MITVNAVGNLTGGKKGACLLTRLGCYKRREVVFGQEKTVRIVNIKARCIRRVWCAVLKKKKRKKGKKGRKKKVEGKDGVG